MSDPFYSLPVRQATFHGRISKVRADKGYANYLNLTAGHYRIRVFLNGKEHIALTADPCAGIIEVDGGTCCVTLTGHVEIKLERDRKPLG
jgi:hypothetical protein